MHSSLQSMLISISNPWNLYVISVKYQNMPAGTPLRPPFLFFFSLFPLIILHHSVTYSKSTSQQPQHFCCWVTGRGNNEIFNNCVAWVPIHQNSCLINQKRGQPWTTRHGCACEEQLTASSGYGCFFFLLEKKIRNLRS